MSKYIHQPLFWCWLLVMIWGLHVIAALLVQSWEGVVISSLALTGAALVLWAIASRRKKNLYPRSH